MRNNLAVAFALAALVLLPVANADVTVAVGPTGISRGDATGARDITVNNGLFAVAFAVDTAPPWGVARGGIVDIAAVRNGEVGYDIASLADFMPNAWSSWPTTYQRVSIEKETASEVIIKTVRDWGEVELETRFTIRDANSTIDIVTRMTNKGDTTLEGLYSGYVVWPDGGSLFGVPGLYGVDASDEDNALADWSAAYDEHWVLGLHAPFAKFLAYDGRDRYLLHNLRPGETRQFDARLQIENDGSLAPLVQAEIEFRQEQFGRVSGRVVSSDGEVIQRPAVVAIKDDQPFVWTLGDGDGGDYEFNLPVGEYGIYATAQGHAQSAIKKVSVSNGSETEIDFNDVEPPGAVHFQVRDAETGQAMDARISVQSGPKSLIGFFGRNTLFTELDTIGKTTVSMPPGDYSFEISAGGGFNSARQVIEIVVEPGRTEELQADIAVLAKPQERGWYSADLHHHSDVLDGFTEAEFVLRSELAAGVDITFLSDHDSVVNNHKMSVLSAARGRQFMPGTEMSPSWAHFNAYPVDDGKDIDIDTGQASVQEIFAAARRMGADVVEVNHPYSAYGYFESLEKEVVPGGYDDSFDLVEIVSGGHDANIKTLERVWRLWNEGKKAYLAGGSDAHDVWLEESGSARTYVYVDGELSVEKFVTSLKAGHAFASQGPLVYPEILFGSEVQLPAGDKLALPYSIHAVSGLRSVQLIERGEGIDVMTFDGTNKRVPVVFWVIPEADTWYSLVMEDTDGKFAYTNPVWVTVTD